MRVAASRPDDAVHPRTARVEAADRTLLEGREGAPSAWIIPADQRDRGATKRLVDVLLATGIELGIADGEVNADGRTYPAGSIVIRREQPYGAHAKDLFDVQRYPQGDAPYDVAGWTLPALLGVRRVEVIGTVDAQVKTVTSVDEALACFHADTRTQDTTAETLSDRDSDAWAAVFKGLSKVRVDDRVLKILTAMPLQDLSQIAHRGARYGMPGWVTEEISARGKIKRIYVTEAQLNTIFVKVNAVDMPDENNRRAVLTALAGSDQITARQLDAILGKVHPIHLPDHRNRRDVLTAVARSSR